MHRAILIPLSSSFHSRVLRIRGSYVARTSFNVVFQTRPKIYMVLFIKDFDNLIGHLCTTLPHSYSITYFLIIKIKLLCTSISSVTTNHDFICIPCFNNVYVIIIFLLTSHILEFCITDIS